MGLTPAQFSALVCIFVLGFPPKRDALPSRVRSLAVGGSAGELDGVDAIAIKFKEHAWDEAVQSLKLHPLNQ